MGAETWISGPTGLRLPCPPTERVPVRGAMSRTGQPIMVELDGRQLRVKGYLDNWSINEEQVGTTGEAWAVLLEDGRRVVLVPDLLHAGWRMVQGWP